MKRLGLNQSSLAKRMHVSRAYIAKLMSGDVNITFGTAMKLAKALEMDFFPSLTPHSREEPQAQAHAEIAPDSKCRRPGR